jgi:hypothetical protein
MTTWQVTTPSACFGIVVDGGTVVECAPYMRRQWLGLPFATIVGFCGRNGWRMERVP